MSKYRRLREALAARELATLVPSPPASRDALVRVHEPAYVDDVLAGTLDPRAMRKIGFPWSAELCARSLASVGGTIAAAQAALVDGIAGNLAGGTHHAHAGWGSGFCVFNDIAVAAAEVLSGGSARRVAVIDLDVHQGDGTAAIFADDPRVLTVSVHCAVNFPFEKRASDLDLALPRGAGDQAYLEATEAAIEACLEHDADLWIYQAGVDPLASDKLGHLSVSAAGLRQRDRRVIDAARDAGIPIALTLGGGYANPLEPTLEAYLATYEIARELFG